jgi:acyl-CoA hydrolase
MAVRIGIATALVAALGLPGCGRKPSHAEIAPGSVVVALGDSLTYGTGASPSTSYPAVLADLSGWRIVNAGIPGETTGEGCSRLPDLLSEHRPRLVLVMLGGNDFLRRLPEAGIVAALHQCIADARAAGVDIVLLSVPRFGGTGLADAALYGEVARSQAVPTIDSGLSHVLAQSSLRADFVHPNADGYRRMAERIAEGLRTLGFLRRS